MKMIHLTMVLAKKVSISSDPANVLLSYPNACLSNVCSMNMRSFFDCSKNAISYKVKKELQDLGVTKIPSSEKIQKKIKNLETEHVATIKEKQELQKKQKTLNIIQQNFTSLLDFSHLASHDHAPTL